MVYGQAEGQSHKIDKMVSVVLLSSQTDTKGMAASERDAK
jgi:hypothetical protein